MTQQDQGNERPGLRVGRTHSGRGRQVDVASHVQGVPDRRKSDTDIGRTLHNDPLSVFRNELLPEDEVEIDEETRARVRELPPW